MRSAVSMLAEGVGFEPTRPFWGLTVFKTAGFNHSPTPPIQGFKQFNLRGSKPSIYRRVGFFAAAGATLRLKRRDDHPVQVEPGFSRHGDCSGST